MIAGQALAQGTLPPLSVETTAPKKTRAKAKAPAPKAEEPAPEAKPADSDDKTRSEAVYKTPAGISIATRADIETFGKIDAGDVLRSMPGVSTRETAQGAGLAINIRGFEGSGRVSMMIDGAKQNFRFTAHEAQGFVFVDPALLAGIDVERGAVSTAGGAGALAGAANLRTLDVDDILKPGKTAGVLSTVTYGTNGVGFKEMVATAAKSDHFGVAFAISHSEPDNYKNGSGVEVPFTFQDTTAGLFKLNMALAPGHTLKIGAVHYNSDYFANNYYQDVHAETYTVKYAYKPLGNPLVDFSFNGYLNKVTMEWLHDSNPANGLGASAGRFVSDRGIGFDTANVSRFALGDIKVAATYGLEYFSDEFTALNKINPALEGGANPTGISSIASAFSQTKLSYGIFDLIAGLRYDSYTLEGTYTPAPDNPLNLPAVETPLDKSDGRLNPKLTLAAQVLPWLQPYVTYAEAFRAPTTFETMLGGNHPVAATSFHPNPFLEPEIQKGWEFGANIRLDRVITPGDALRFKIAYFDMDVENYITACGPASKAYFCNAAGISIVRGVELEGKYDAGVFFAGLSYTYNHTDLPTQLDGLGAHAYLPEHTAVLTAGLRLLEQRLTIGARVSYFSESFVGDANVGSFYSAPFMPGYTLVDLFSSYQFDNGLELGLNVTNLFDVDYTAAMTTPIVGFPVAPTTCFGSNLANCSDSGRGRTILLTAKMKF